MELLIFIKLPYGSKDLYYYDVNSLYPYVMLNDMPLELIKIHENMDFKDIENFFGLLIVWLNHPL